MNRYTPIKKVWNTELVQMYEIERNLIYWWWKYIISITEILPEFYVIYIQFIYFIKIISLDT